MSTKDPSPGWILYSFDSMVIPIFELDAIDYRATQIYSFASGINKEAFALFANIGNKVVIIFRRPGKEGDPYARRVLSTQEDFDQVAGVLRKIDLSDSLMAHATLSSAIELLRKGAERHFVNLGIFSNYFLRERLTQHLSQRGRKLEYELSSLLDQFDGELPIDYEGSRKILSALGFELKNLGSNPNEFKVLSKSRDLDTICVLSSASSLDTKGESTEAVPSYQAVSALARARWVILTNGRIWRLYSSRISSPSTNYFEIDLESVSSQSDPRLRYFVSIFSSLSLIPKTDGSDLDSIYYGSQKYAQDIEEELRTRVFEGQRFLILLEQSFRHLLLENTLKLILMEQRRPPFDCFIGFSSSFTQSQETFCPQIMQSTSRFLLIRLEKNLTNLRRVQRNKGYGTN